MTTDETKMILEQISKFSNEVNSRFDGIGKRFDTFEESVNNRFDQVDKHLRKHDRRLNKIDRRLDGIDFRIDEAVEMIHETRDRVKRIELQNISLTNRIDNSVTRVEVEEMLKN